ncbi:MAG: RHS repeat domain-containing protein, partial [Dolichospermum sp.]
NNSGAVVNHFVYDSFGQVISESNPAIDTRYLFTGREFDQEIGLYYYRARYYDATNGRFISLDPINIGSGTVNLYSYVGGNPISFVDLFGNKRCSGNARVLKGNKGLIGKEGAFSGNKKYPVTDDSAAILLEQFRKSKADLRPDIDNISGKIGDPNNPICTFNKVRDRIDDENARKKSKKTPYEMWKERSPGNFIVELPGIDKDLGVQPIELSVPDSYPCPEGTSEVK